MRQILRGQRLLKQAGQLGRIDLVKQVLTDQALSLTNKVFSSLVMGSGVESAEIVLRQYLLIRFAGNVLTRGLLMAAGKEHGRVVLALPKEWRKVLTQHNFQVANFRSALLWQFYIFAMLLYGVALICRIAFAGITSKKNKDFKQNRYAYFADLGLGNLPQSINGNHSYDIISWYLQWPGKRADIDSIRHSVANSTSMLVGDVAVVPQRSIVPALTEWKSIIKYAIWGIGASIIAMFDCLRGRWWHALLLNQAALAGQVRNLSADCLACEYLFHNSGWIYRPLWTYEAERLGSGITFYFYSTNCEGFKKPDGYPHLSYGYKAMNWPHYLVWDEYQGDFVRRAVGEQGKISVVGPIWFQTSTTEMPELSKRSVAVFDVQPFRNSIYRTFGVDFEYYIPHITLGFLSDVHKSIEKCDGVMALKIKRNIGNIAHPLYRRKLAELKSLDDIIFVAPEFSAIRLIENCSAVISAPFTSTALIAKEMGKPSIYYDPSGFLQKDDRAAHGIPILSGVDELNDWLITVVEKNH